MIKIFLLSKVWHGTIHALSFFAQLPHDKLSQLKAKRTIEIGCGCAVLSIFAARFLDAPYIACQDLVSICIKYYSESNNYLQNRNVLEAATRVNMQLNDVRSDKFELIAGIWDSCFEGVPPNSYVLRFFTLLRIFLCFSFSLILTSDTVYRTKNFECLHRAFDRLLDHESDSRMFVLDSLLYIIYFI